MLTFEEIEPVDFRPYYLVTGICDNCGVLFRKNRTHNKPDTTQKVYCMKCQQEMKSE